MKKFAKPADLSKAEEKYWKEAEDIVDEQYSKTKEPEKFWGTVTNIFKAKVDKHLDHDPFVEARKRKKKREKKEKKSEWMGRVNRFEKRADDLTSTQVPELAQEDLLPLIKRTQDELQDLFETVAKGFETGDEKEASEVELSTYREMPGKLHGLLSQTQEVKNWFSDMKNTTYTDVTGEMPGVDKESSMTGRAHRFMKKAQGQTDLKSLQDFTSGYQDYAEMAPGMLEKAKRLLLAEQDPQLKRLLQQQHDALAQLIGQKPLV